MTTPAHVTSIEALHEFRAALIRFADDATAAVDSLRQEVLRTIEWIQHDRPAYWRQQVQRSFDRVAQARTRLEIAQMRAMDGQGPSCIEEKKALTDTRRRLQFAQDQINVVRHWAIKLERESDDFRARIGHVEGILKRELPMAIGRLQRMAEALDRYAEQLPRSEGAESAEAESKSKSGTAGRQPASPADEPQREE